MIETICIHCAVLRKPFNEKFSFYKLIKKDTSLKLLPIRNLYRALWIIFLIFSTFKTGFVNESNIVESDTNVFAYDNPSIEPNSSMNRKDFDYNSFDQFETVKEYSRLYGIDYKLVLAIIRQESMFNHDVVSSKGATGLMQLMPFTHMEVAEKLELENLDLPEVNIRSGIYYFARLGELFTGSTTKDKLSLALAAYNAGPGRIYDAQDIAAYLREDPNDWQVIEKMLPLLSKRYYTLHRSIWEEGKPRSGYFGSWRQTVSYVQSVLKIYEEYSLPNG